MSDPASAPPFRVIDRKVVYQGFTRLEVLDVEQVTRAGETIRMRREIETHGAGAAVLAYDPQRKSAILVKQLRVPVGLAEPIEAYVLEAIAGLADHPGDDPATTARREAQEEAGLMLDQMQAVGKLYSSPGLSAECLSLFLAEIDFTTARTGIGGGLADEQEDIEVIELPLANLARLADSGALRDLKTFALIQTLRLKRPDLFKPIAD